MSVNGNLADFVHDKIEQLALNSQRLSFGLGISDRLVDETSRILSSLASEGILGTRGYSVIMKRGLERIDVTPCNPKTKEKYLFSTKSHASLYSERLGREAPKEISFEVNMRAY